MAPFIPALEARGILASASNLETIFMRTEQCGSVCSIPREICGDVDGDMFLRNSDLGKQIMFDLNYLMGYTAEMLFDKRAKGVIRAVWTVLAILIIISMVLLYAPIF